MNMTKHKLFRITTVPLSFFSLLKGQLRFMSNHYEVKGISSDGELRVEAEKNESVEIIPIEMTRRISPFKDLRSLWLLYKLFKKEKPLIVHTHTPKAGTVGMLAAKLAGVPHRLHTVAGLPLLEIQGNKRVLLDIVEKATYACATMIYPNSMGLHNIILTNKYTKAEKLKVIGQGSSNGIDTGYFSSEHYSPGEKQRWRANLQIHDDEFVFVFVGRLVKDKGINELIKAFKALEDGIQNRFFKRRVLRLLLVGNYEDELDPLLTETIHQIESNQNITFVGFQKDVRPYFAISDALVFPSYREGFPNVVMQAGSMGLPSIVSDINGCNEIINEGENGIIIPVKNADAIYYAMNRFVYDEKLYNRLRSNARRLIVERYEQQMVWEAILEEYKHLERNV